MWRLTTNRPQNRGVAHILRVRNALDNSVLPIPSTIWSLVVGLTRCLTPRAGGRNGLPGGYTGVNAARCWVTCHRFGRRNGAVAGELLARSRASRFSLSESIVQIGRRRRRFDASSRFVRPPPFWAFYRTARWLRSRRLKRGDSGARHPVPRRSPCSCYQR